MPDIGRQALRGAGIGGSAGLCLAAGYLALLAIGTTESDKSLAFSLLFVGFPALFAVVPALEWLGLQGGSREGVAALLLTLSLNGVLWGTAIGATLGLTGLRRPTTPRT